MFGPVARRNGPPGSAQSAPSPTPYLAPHPEAPLTRHDGRAPGEIRPLQFTRGLNDHAHGEVLVSSGRTRVLCTVSVQEQVPHWMRAQGIPGGWLTGEYSMLPGSTSPRKIRDGRGGRAIDGRSQEIQRLIGRALRRAVNLKKLPDITLWVDCDVISADGGTRTAAINGGMVALEDALRKLEKAGRLGTDPRLGLISAISVGMMGDSFIADLDYKEDSSADVDLNVVCTEDGRLVEVQGAAEGEPFAPDAFHQLLGMAQDACAAVQKAQRAALEAGS